MIILKQKKPNLNSASGELFKVSDINAAIFEAYISTDSFGHKKTDKEGAGWDNMTAILVMFKQKE